MAIDENYFKYHFIVLMILFAVVSVALIVYGRAVVKREIRDEVNRYDLDYTQVPDSVVYDYYNENGEILFSDEGMHVNDDFYWYNHMRIRILYEMYLHRVIIRVGFSTEKNGTYIIPFDARSIKMLYQFNVRVENAEEMERILKDTYSAFEAIYKKGKL